MNLISLKIFILCSELEEIFGEYIQIINTLKNRMNLITNDEMNLLTSMIQQYEMRMNKINKLLDQLPSVKIEQKISEYYSKNIRMNIELQSLNINSNL